MSALYGQESKRIAYSDKSLLVVLVLMLLVNGDLSMVSFTSSSCVIVIQIDRGMPNVAYYAYKFIG